MWDTIIEYLPQLIIVIIGLFPAWKGIKYFQFGKELLDIYVSYKKAMKNGVFTDDEKIDFADEVVEAIEAAKGLKKVDKATS